MVVVSTDPWELELVSVGEGNPGVELMVRGAVDEAALARLSDDARRVRFFQLWTLKEAYIKAVGRGLGLPLDSFDVSLGRGSEARLLRASALCEDARCWSLAAPEGPPRTSLAVVLESDSIVVLPDIPPIA